MTEVIVALVAIVAIVAIFFSNVVVAEGGPWGIRLKSRPAPRASDKESSKVENK